MSEDLNVKFGEVLIATTEQTAVSKALAEEVAGKMQSIDDTTNAAVLKMEQETENAVGDIGAQRQSIIDQVTDTVDSAAARAETAADIASQDRNIHPDTTTGLGVTPVGEYFYVAVPDNDAILSLYRNEAGSAVKIGDILSNAGATKANLSLASKLVAPSSQYPNMIEDPTGYTNVGLRRWSKHWGGLQNNVRCMKMASESTSIQYWYPQKVFKTGRCSAFMEVLRKPLGVKLRFMILQYGQDGSEIARSALEYGADEFWDGSRFLEIENVTVLPETLYLSYYIDNYGDGSVTSMTSFCINDGARGGFRDTLGNEVLDILNDPSMNYSTPNIITDPGFTTPELWDNRVSRRWDSEKERYFLAIPSAASPSRDFGVTEAMKDIGKFSAGITLGEPSVGFTSGRFLVTQVDKDGTELWRHEDAFDAGFEGGLRLRVTGTVHASAERIRVYLHNKTNSSIESEMLCTDITLRAGVETRYLPPAPPVPTQINLFIDPDMNEGALYGSNYQTREVIGGTNRIVLTDCPTQAGVRWYQPALNALAPGNTFFVGIRYKMVSAHSAFDLTVIYRDSTDAEVGRGKVSGTNNIGDERLISLECVPPEGTTKLEIRPSWWGSEGNPLSGEIWDLTVSKEDPKIVKVLHQPMPVFEFPEIEATHTRIFVAPDGSDSNDGSSSKPVRSLNKAAELLKGVGTIAMEPGQYFGVESIYASNAINLNVVVNGSSGKAHIVTGDRIEGFTLAAGETDLYYSASNALKGTSKKWIWEGWINDEETRILKEERAPEHGGRTHRLEHTKLRRYNSLSDLKAVDRGFYAPSDGGLYVKLKGEYTSIHDAWIVNPVYSGITFNGNNAGQVKLVNVVVDFGGINVSNMAYAELWNTESVGSAGQGLVGDTSHVRTFNHRSGGSDNDGMNWHNTRNVDILGTSACNTSAWCHDCGDDGDSMHEHCVGTYWGGLFEYNQDRGSAPSYGSHTVYHNVRTRKNGYRQSVTGNMKGEGIGLVGYNHNDHTFGTSVRCFNCVDEESHFSFANHGTDKAHGEVSVMELFNCHSIRSKHAAYSARGWSTLTMHNCTELESQNLIKDDSEGTILVKNGNLVT